MPIPEDATEKVSSISVGHLGISPSPARRDMHPVPLTSAVVLAPGGDSHEHLDRVHEPVDQNGDLAVARPSSGGDDKKAKQEPETNATSQ